NKLAIFHDRSRVLFIVLPLCSGYLPVGAGLELFDRARRSLGMRPSEVYLTPRIPERTLTLSLPLGTRVWKPGTQADAKPPRAASFTSAVRRSSFRAGRAGSRKARRSCVRSSNPLGPAHRWIGAAVRNRTKGDRHHGSSTQLCRREARRTQ